MGETKVVTLRFDEDEVEEIDAEYEERGYPNRTAYLTHIIRNRDSIDPNTADRLDELEQRLAELEDEVNDE